MLVKLLPEQWQLYVNVPEVMNGVVRLRSLIVPGPGPYHIGLAAIWNFADYRAGDVLQWAAMVKTTTPPTVLNIGVQSGHGDENTLSIRGERGLPIPENWSWVTSEVIMVDEFKPHVYLWTPEPHKEIHMKVLALGDPESIRRLTRQNILPWVAGGIGILAIIGIIASKKRK